MNVQMAKKSSPWIDRFVGVSTIQEIRNRTFIGAVSMRELALLPVEQACKQLNFSLESIYIAGPQHCDILQRHVERAKGFSHDKFATQKDYFEGVYGAASTKAEVPPWCLTGQAGTGKSQLMAALGRLFPARQTNELQPNHPYLPMNTVKRIQINSQISDLEVLRSLANPAFLSSRMQISRSELESHLRQWFFTQGVATLVIDELQFLTQSVTANTRVAQLLMMISYLGVPWTYVINYSLGHKLLARPQEERQRLITQPMILNPASPHSAHWVEIVDEFSKVNPNIIDLNGERDGESLHRLTGGIVRLLRLLIVEAFRQTCRTSSQRIVRMEEIARAYKSAAFYPQRIDVEALASLANSTLLSKSRRDLVCPFPSHESLVVQSTANLKSRTRSQPSSAVEKMIESTLSPDGKLALKQLREAQRPQRSSALNVDIPSQVRKKTKLTTETLLAGARLMRAQEMGGSKLNATNSCANNG